MSFAMPRLCSKVFFSPVKLKQLYTHELDISSDIYLKDSISTVLKDRNFLNVNLFANQTHGNKFCLLETIF